VTGVVPAADRALVTTRVPTFLRAIDGVADMSDVTPSPAAGEVPTFRATLSWQTKEALRVKGAATVYLEKDGLRFVGELSGSFWLPFNTIEHIRIGHGLNHRGRPARPHLSIWRRGATVPLVLLVPRGAEEYPSFALAVCRRALEGEGDILLDMGRAGRREELIAAARFLYAPVGAFLLLVTTEPQNPGAYLLVLGLCFLFAAIAILNVRRKRPKRLRSVDEVVDAILYSVEGHGVTGPWLIRTAGRPPPLGDYQFSSDKDKD